MTPIDPSKGTAHLFGHVIAQWHGEMLSTFVLRTSEDSSRLTYGTCWDYGEAPECPLKERRAA